MAQQKFKGFNNSHFVLCGEGLERVNRGGSYTLMEGYIDDKGNYVTYYVGTKDKKGAPVGKRFRFDLSLRRLLVRDSDKDFNGLKLFDFLKNYPACEGSPYGEYVKDKETGKTVQVGIMFREMNNAKDAEVALEADELRIKAQSEVLSLDDQTLEEVAAILGHYGSVDKTMRLKVLEYAGKRPAEYFELMKSGDRTIRATVRKAIDAGIFTRKGSVIYWESTPVGADEDGAIAALLRDPSMLNALQEKLGYNPTPVKKPVGNPNLRKKAEPTKVE